MTQPIDPRLQALLQSEPALWRGQQRHADHRAFQSTGYRALDAVLPGQGWPVAGVVEVVTRSDQAPPLQPFVPLMARCTQAGQTVLLVDPPPALVPFAPAWQQAGVVLSTLFTVQSQTRKQAWWVMETALRATACALVLIWPCARGGRLGVATVRRWQVAAAAGSTLGVLFVPESMQGQASNVHLRLRMQGQQLTVLKARGMHDCPQVSL